LARKYFRKKLKNLIVFRWVWRKTKEIYFRNACFSRAKFFLRGVSKYVECTELLGK